MPAFFLPLSRRTAWDCASPSGHCSWLVARNLVLLLWTTSSSQKKQSWEPSAQIQVINCLWNCQHFSSIVTLPGFRRGGCSAEETRGSITALMLESILQLQPSRPGLKSQSRIMFFRYCSSQSRKKGCVGVLEGAMLGSPAGHVHQAQGYISALKETTESLYLLIPHLLLSPT